jgi:hypothetical protein
MRRIALRAGAVLAAFVAGCATGPGAALLREFSLVHRHAREPTEVFSAPVTVR